MAPNPFDPTEMVVMAKAITPDVALFHGSKGDSRGNVLVSKGGEALMLAQASDKVVVTVEEIVDSVSSNDPTGTFIPAIHIKAVAHAPFGAYPSACPGYYGMDMDEMKKYLEASSSARPLKITWPKRYSPSTTTRTTAERGAWGFGLLQRWGSVSTA